MKQEEIKQEEIKQEKMKYLRLLSPATFYADADKRYQELTKVKQKVEERLSKAPEGKIHIVNSDTRTQFYLREESSDRSGKYIRKSEERTIQTHLQKAYDEKILKLLNAEIKCLETFLSNSRNISQRVQQSYSDYPTAVKSYINPIDVSDEDFAKDWSSEIYQGKELPEYVTVYETSCGERVRSKSELTIANMLAERKVPYKYECPLTLQNGTVVYPDFTVLNVKQRKVIYWEHRGMMDDRDYARQAVFKMKSLMQNGIVLGDNLIITEETYVNPLGTNEINEVIKRYFG